MTPGAPFFLILLCLVGGGVGGGLGRGKREASDAICTKANQKHLILDTVLYCFTLYFMRRHFKGGVEEAGVGGGVQGGSD